MTNVSWAPGLNDAGGGSFNGGWVSVPDAPKLRITGALTVSAWVRPRQFSTSTSAVAYIVNKTNQSANGWRLLLATRPNVTFSVSASSATGAMPTTGWTHLAAVYRPSESIELYVNGSSAGKSTTDVPTAIVDSQNELRIGSRYDGQYPFVGDLDDVRVYERALSAEEITDLSTQH
jgi:hypothetical protein